MNYELNLENVRLRSLVEATETELFDQKKKRRRLERENAALKAVIREILYDLLESNPIMSDYWRKKTHELAGSK